MAEPVVMFAHTLRVWAHHLHTYVMDHGDAIVRGYAMTAEDALSEQIDILIVDDITSFLSARLVSDLRQRGVGVIGMYEDSQDSAGRGFVLSMGADVALSAATPPEIVVAELIRMASSDRQAEPPRSERGGSVGFPAGGTIVAVGSTGGGCGATEVALAYAQHSASRGLTTVLVDADAQSPGIAPRLALKATPNVRSAIDAVFHRAGPLSRCLQVGPTKSLQLLVGITTSADWSELGVHEVLEVLGALTTDFSLVVANVGGMVEELPGIGQLARFGVARAVVSTADSLPDGALLREDLRGWTA